MNSPAAPLPTRARLPGLDGVRALAIVLVLAYHLFPGLAPGGFVGVDVFFVVSGYLITALLLAEHAQKGRITLGRFWSRRARRLLPALVLMVSTSVTAAALLGGDVLVSIGWQMLGAATFSSNWLAIAQGSSYLEQTSPELLRHMWSLAVEEQFYLLWPLVLIGILLLPRKRWAVLALGLLAGASAVAMGVTAGGFGGDSAAASAAYYSTLTHGFGLLAGAGLAIVRSPLTSAHLRDRVPGIRRISGPVADVIVSASAMGIVLAATWLTIDGSAAYRGGLALVVALTVTLIAAIAHPEGRAAGLADAPLPRWIGERSYGLYLWHWPVIVLLSAALPAVDRTGLAGWGLGVMALAVSVGLAAASYSWLEQPIRRGGWAALRPQVGGRSIVRGAIAAAALVALVCGPTFALVRAPGMSSAEAAIAAGEAAIREPVARVVPMPPTVPSVQRPVEWIESAQAVEPSPEPQPEPVPVPEPEPQPQPLTGNEILAIGDSVLLASAPALQERFPGIAIDAAVSRQMTEAPRLLREHAEASGLRPVVILALGTNGPISTATLDEVREILGPERELVLVTTQAPRGWTAAVNASLIDFAARYPTVELSDWQAAIQPRLDLLAGDQIHPGPTGAIVYATALEEPLARLAILSQ
jgi:peptidoglycan/LPS O-acetylase OafA/YrhL